MKRSKVLDRLVKNDERFTDYFYENSDMDDRSSIWLYCAEGYICPEMNCGTIHEYTVVEVMKKARTVRKETE